MSKYYIGLASSRHDPAIAIVDSQGEVVFAEGTERYLQDKRAWHCRPDHLIRTRGMLDKLAKSCSAIVIAKSWREDNLESWLKDLKQTDGSKQKSESALSRWIVPEMIANTHGAGESFLYNIQVRHLENIKCEVRDFDHHLTHAATGCYASPYAEAACAVFDGTGERTSMCFYSYKDGKIKPIVGSESTASLGNFYSLLCDACGFDFVKGEEWKVMGLAPYGKLDPEMYEFLMSIFEIEDLNLNLTKFGNVKLAKLESMRPPKGTHPREMADLAFTGQKVFCDIVFALLRNFQKRGLSKNLVFSGGSALNSACNGKILDETDFESLFVYSAPADDGNAVGAALLAYAEDNPKSILHDGRVLSPFLGSEISDEAVERLETYGGLKKLDYKGNLSRAVAELLFENKIIGWVQGKAEFGPRSLGNRSILADPRRHDIKELINAKVKFREEYRPFAPSILHEYGTEYFENYQFSPYMERALRFKADKISVVPGVVHVDQTGRLQSVTRELNQKFYDLIKAFFEITQVPILLNTSFNVMGKPIIHSLEDAVAVYLTSGLDALVVGDQVYVK